MSSIYYNYSDLIKIIHCRDIMNPIYRGGDKRRQRDDSGTTPWNAPGSRQELSYIH